MVVKKSQIFLITMLVLSICLLNIPPAIAAPLPDGFPPPSAAWQVEIKFYPACRAATVLYTGDLSQATERSFSALFAHISSNDISMTAPVETRYPLSTWEERELGSDEDRGEALVSFLYESQTVEPQSLLDPVTVEDREPMTVLSIGVRGSYSYTKYKEGIEQLAQWLRVHPEYQVVGSPRRLFYDSPFVPAPFKRSEVQIPVVKVSSSVP
jgi:hypothetical protein